MKNEKTQHTPAPWKIDYQDDLWASIISANEGHIVTVPNRNDEQRANAQLIARAPELLKENEQLKVDVREARFDKKEFKNWFELEKARSNKLSILNAELLEALKVAKEHWNAPIQRKLQVIINKQIDSAIAKAEGKTLVGS